MASQSEEDTLSTPGQDHIEIPRKSSRKTTLSLKAKESKLSKLNSKIILVIIDKRNIHALIRDDLKDCIDEDLLNANLESLEDSNTDISNLYEQIIDVSENQPIPEVSNAYRDFEVDRLATIEAVNDRLDHLTEYHRGVLQENLKKLSVRRSSNASSTHTAQDRPNSPAPIENKSDASKAEPAAIAIAEAIAKSISQNLRAGRMAEPPPEIFRGDYLKYEDWIFSFDAYVDGKGFSDAEK